MTGIPPTWRDAARGQDPGDLGSRDGHVEPVHSVAGQHRINGCVRQRYHLRATRQRPDTRQRAAQLGQHRRIRLDRSDLGAHRNHRGGELASTGAKVEHPPAGHWLNGPAHRSLRVVRAVLGVRGRRPPNDEA